MWNLLHNRDFCNKSGYLYSSPVGQRNREERIDGKQAVSCRLMMVKGWRRSPITCCLKTGAGSAIYSCYHFTSVTRMKDLISDSSPGLFPVDRLGFSRGLWGDSGLVEADRIFAMLFLKSYWNSRCSYSFFLTQGWSSPLSELRAILSCERLFGNLLNGMKKKEKDFDGKGVCWWLMGFPRWRWFLHFKKRL